MSDESKDKASVDPGLPGGEWEIAAEVGRRYLAELMAGSLQAAGIDARVVDKSFRQEPLPSVRSFAIVRVYVPADRAEEAKKILAEAALPDEAEGEGGEQT